MHWVRLSVDALGPRLTDLSRLTDSRAQKAAERKIVLVELLSFGNGCPLESSEPKRKNRGESYVGNSHAAGCCLSIETGPACRMDLRVATFRFWDGTG
jgi:hypothetical protein